MYPWAVRIIIRFGENNVLRSIYIDIYQFCGWAGWVFIVLVLVSFSEQL